MRPEARMEESVDSRRRNEARASDLVRLARYARWLDASIGIPGTRLRLGVDSVVGLVPVAGDLAGVLLSSFIVYRAWRLGVSRTTLLRMLGNLGLEGTVGAIPVVGDVFDIWFRANQRNVALLEQDEQAVDTSEKSISRHVT